MPIKIKSVDIEMRLLPLMLKDDGSSEVTVRMGYMDEGTFRVVEGNTIHVSVADTSHILDVAPTPGLTRRSDLAMAVYTWLVENNHVAAGIIS